MRKLILVLLFLVSNTLSFSQSEWQRTDQYLVKDGKEVFVAGVNYLPSKDWHFALESQGLDLYERDFAAMHELGVKCIRFFPMWPLMQEEADKVSEEMIRKLKKILDLAQKYDLAVQLTPFTGWMSGGSFLPPWARGDLFRDPEIIKGELLLAETLAKNFRGHPALQAYDFGNELNVFVEMANYDYSREDIDLWLKQIHSAFRKGDPDVLITNGIGTGYVHEFDTRIVSRYVDFMAPHTYPWVHRTSQLDPRIGLRTTYSSNYSICWTQMEGKPSMMQEIGKGDNNVPAYMVSDYLAITMISNWADGAAGYLWWGSHNIDADYSIDREHIYLPFRFGEGLSDYKVGRTDSNMGLLTTGNKAKKAGITFRDCNRTIQELGLGWKEESPVAYIVIPEEADFNTSMVKYINPYVLLKQVHADVKMIRESQKVPGDAAAVLVCDFSLSKAGKKNIGNYLKKGGRVYQSGYNDFTDKIQLTGKVDTLQVPRIWTNSKLGTKFSGEPLHTPPLVVKEIVVDDGVRNLAVILSEGESPLEWTFGEPFYCQTNVGKGSYYFLAANLEAALSNTYNPWKEDESCYLYNAFLDEPGVIVDSKFVEVFRKSRNGKSLMILVNHTDEFQRVALSAGEALKFTSLDEKNSFVLDPVHYLKMKPAEHLIFHIE